MDRLSEIRARCEAATKCDDWDDVPSALVFEDIPYLLDRAEKAEAERDKLKQILDTYGGEAGITAALKERDSFKAALKDMQFAYMNKDNPPHQFEIEAMQRAREILKGE